MCCYNNNCKNMNPNENTNFFGCLNYNLPNNLQYGSAYVPVQNLNTVYSPAEGLSKGSMFPELVMPYCPNQSLEVVNYLKNYNERRCNR